MVNMILSENDRKDQSVIVIDFVMKPFRSRALSRDRWQVEPFQIKRIGES